MKTFQHTPVLLQEVLYWLDPKPGMVILDGTVGGGGHAEAILQRMAGEGRYVGLDQDPAALNASSDRLKPYWDQVELIHSNFAQLDRVLADLNLSHLSGALFDLGVSSFQLDEEERGFSYHGDAPLDMRMDQSNATSAYHLVNGLTEAELARILRLYGEERWAARIANFIVRERSKQPIATTAELVRVIKAAVPRGARQDGPHPARRTFQALRIAVNRELDVLEEALSKAMHHLVPGGRLCVISFHSLEDRIVKQAMRAWRRGCTCPPNWPVCQCGGRPLARILTPKPIEPSMQEIEANPRARSAKLRVAERV